MEKINAGKSSAAVDPVCGMKVERAMARFKTDHNGQEYFFCCAGCLTKFLANPSGVLAAPPKPMGTGLVSLGGSAAGAGLLSIGMPSAAKPAAASKAASTPAIATQDSRTYVCPMCPEVRQTGPGPCPKCGMALDRESLDLAPTKTEYTCPMHPEIVRAEPGSCPICGMALEPRTVTAEEENPELRDMTRRFWIALVLTVPLLAIAMGSMIWPSFFVRRVDTLAGYRYQYFLWGWGLPWLELLLATPVVLWCGWPFFQRGWASVVNRSTNMFTLIAMGTGVAYVY
ncbi:MAG: heavy metal-binding domain-containing protein, partial [Terriglobales bacterium]